MLRKAASTKGKVWGKRWKACSVAGNSMLNKPYSRNKRKQSKACPDKNSLSTSSNIRAGETCSNKGASVRIGACVWASMEKPNLAAKRIARSMRTGSSR